MRRRIGAAMVAAMGLWVLAGAALAAQEVGQEVGQTAPMARPWSDRTAPAQDPPPEQPSARGPVTGLEMPRYVSLRAGEGNARRGPGLTHRIDWVFTRREMPLRVVAEFEHWRRVEDAEGLGGWMHFALLSGMRTVLVREDMVPLHLQPDPRAPVAAYLEIGVIARLQSCERAWCRLRADGVRGWAEKSALWGVDPGEIID